MVGLGFPPRCPQVVWCHWGEIEPFSATLAQDALAECVQPGTDMHEIHSFSHSAILTRATERTDSAVHSFSHWAIMTRAMAGNWTQTTGRIHSEIHSFSHCAIMTRAIERTDSEIRSFSHWAIRALTNNFKHSPAHYPILQGNVIMIYSFSQINPATGSLQNKITSIRYKH